MKQSSTVHSCNVLETRTDGRRLWRFDADGGKVKLSGEESIAVTQPLPARSVAKDWQSLFRTKLNIAWLPAGNVFVRVVQLPVAEFSETLQMVELQLEKLSPLPVTQIVWSIESLPAPIDNTQTVIVVIAARSAVEDFLGNLETEGYLPDRLELPELQQLLATEVDDDGVWVYSSTDTNLCLVAWRSTGTLQNIQLLHLPANGNRAELLVDQLTKVAWAGELEGWLAPPVRVHIVSDATTVALWEPALRQWSNQPVRTLEPRSTRELAELTARRAARAESTLNLVPIEYVARYRQQFVDRLWMRGLGAVVAVYVVGVLIYLGALRVMKFQSDRLQKQVIALTGSYTNVLEIKARIDVLQDQLALKYAALDAFKVASELLPPDLTLKWLNFQKGESIHLQGVAPRDKSSAVTDYNAALQKATLNGQPVFREVSPPRTAERPAPGGVELGWDFDCYLNRAGME